jgi:hypothetical protein
MSTVIHSSYAPTYSADNPVIGWNSATQRGTAGASSSADGYSYLNAADPDTTTFWRPSANPADVLASWSITLPAAETFTYCGIASHNLGSTGCQVRVQGYDGSAWVNLTDLHTPESDDAILFLFGGYETDQIRLRILGGLAPSIAVIMFGDVLELPRRFYQGHTPIDLAVEATFTNNYTRGGQIAGRSVEFNGNRTPFTINHIPEDWIRANFMAFMEESLYRPFFFAERPQGYPDALDYVLTEAPIQPQRTGPLNLMSITI